MNCICCLINKLTEAIQNIKCDVPQPLEVTGDLTCTSEIPQPLQITGDVNCNVSQPIEVK